MGGCLQTVRNKGEKLLSGLPTEPSALGGILQEHQLELQSMYDAEGLQELLHSIAEGKKQAKGPKLPSFFRWARNARLICNESSISANTFSVTAAMLTQF